MFSVTSRSRCCGVELGLFEHLHHDLGERLGTELAQRDVDRHREVRPAALLPGPLLLAGPAQHPLTDLFDLARGLGDGDEVRGRDLPELRVLPAQQGLRAHEMSGARVDLRLVVELELVALEGKQQVLLDPGLRRRPVAQRRRVEREGVAALALGRLHGQVGIAHQLLAGPALLGEQGDAHARGHSDLATADQVRLGDAVEHLAGGQRGVVRSTQVEQDGRQLVAAQARDHLTAAQAVGDAVADALEQPVAARVRKYVVHAGEAVQVDRQQGHALLVALGELDRAFRELVEQLAVRQAGHVVVRGQIALGGARLLQRAARGVQVLVLRLERPVLLRDQLLVAPQQHVGLDAVRDQGLGQGQGQPVADACLDALERAAGELGFAHRQDGRVRQRGTLQQRYAQVARRVRLRRQAEHDHVGLHPLCDLDGAARGRGRAALEGVLAQGTDQSGAPARVFVDEENRRHVPGRSFPAVFSDAGALE